MELKQGTNEWWKIYNDDKEAVSSFFRKRRVRRIIRPTLWTNLSPRLQQDKELALLAVRNGRVDLTDELPEIFRNDKKLLMATFKNRELKIVPGCRLWQKLSPSLRNDKEIIMAAMENRRIQLLDHLPSSIRYEKDVVMAAYNQHLLSRNYKEECFSDVRLWKLPDKLRDDKDVVMLELSKVALPVALRHASSRLRDDEDVVRHAVMKSSRAMHYAPMRLRDDYSFVLSLLGCVGRDGIIDVVSKISRRLRNDQSIIMAAVRINAAALYYASDDMKSNKEIVMAAVLNYGVSLEFASKCLRNDFDVCISAVRQNRHALLHVSKELKSDQSFVLQAVRSCFRVLELVDDEWHSHPDVVYEALQDTRTATSNKQIRKVMPDEYSRTKRRLLRFRVVDDVRVLRNNASYDGYKIFFRRLRHVHDKLMAHDDTLIACLFPSKRTSKRGKVETGPINVKKWVTPQLERFWLVQHICPSKSWDKNIQKKVTEFAGYDKMIEHYQSLSKELQACERVINRLIELEWKIPMEK